MAIPNLLQNTLKVSSVGSGFYIFDPLIPAYSY